MSIVLVDAESQFAAYDQGCAGWSYHNAFEPALSVNTPPFKISGFGKQVRHVVYADEMIRVSFKAAGRANHARGRAYYIAGGIANSLSLNELFAQLERPLGIQLQLSRDPPRTNDQRVYVADITNATHEVGWGSEGGAGVGIHTMLAWVDAIESGQA